MGQDHVLGLADADAVAAQLGHTPKGAFTVVVRDEAGAPSVIRNAPFLYDGTPMPTLYWLTSPALIAAIGKLESSGGVKQAEVEVDPVELQAAHARYASERDALIGLDVTPRPAGGVGGTRRGVKCLHAHYAYLLAGGDDPVGRWVHNVIPAKAGIQTTWPRAERFLDPGLRRDDKKDRRDDPVAAIDCGTNSTRLLVLDGDNRRVVEELRITRLGEGVHKNRYLLQPAMERTIAALDEYRELLVAHDVKVARAVATSAVRDATNASEFLTRAEAALGVPVDVISGEEEALLTYAGATRHPQTDACLVVDIGGGSTEMVFGEGDKILNALSLDMGSVRLTELHLHDDPPTSEQLVAARSFVRRELEGVDLPDGAFQLTAVAGTATTLASVDLGLASYDFDAVSGHEVTVETVERLLASLAAQTVVGRTALAGMPQGRAEVIVGGIVVLAELMATLRASRCTVSATDLLDGLAMRQWANDR